MEKAYNSPTLVVGGGADGGLRARWKSEENEEEEKEEERETDERKEEEERERDRHYGMEALRKERKGEERE